MKCTDLLCRRRKRNVDNNNKKCTSLKFAVTAVSEIAALAWKVSESLVVIHCVIAHTKGNLREIKAVLSS